MKKLSMIMYLFVFAALLLSSCRLGFGFDFDTEINPEIDIEPNVNPEISLSYTISKETGVYSSFSMDAEQTAVLSVGTQVRPADGNSSLECESMTDAGVTYSLCKIEVVSSGVTGWVLEETLSE